MVQGARQETCGSAPPHQWPHQPHHTNLLIHPTGLSPTCWAWVRTTPPEAHASVLSAPQPTSLCLSEESPLQCLINIVEYQ